MDKKYEEIEVLTHSSIRISGERRVYADPFQMAAAPHDGDIVLITHDHYDHYSPEDLAKVLKEDTILVVPASMAAKVKDVPGERLVALAAGETKTVDGVSIEAVPAYNVGKAFHPRANGWLGYILTMNGLRYYIAGDTDWNDDNNTVACDVALVPIGGTYTMDAREAADFVNHLKPRAAVPTHYGNIVGERTDGQVFEMAVAPGIDVCLKIR